MSDQDQDLQKYYLQSIQKLFFRPAHRPEDIEGIIREQYKESKQALEDAIKSGAPTNQVTAQKNAFFIYAVGMFVLGEANAANHVLDNIPSSGAIRDLAKSLTAFLPIPDDLDPFSNPHEFRLWLKEHVERMAWDNQHHAYRLK